MQVVQRGMLQRIGLLIGRNRDDDRPVDLADRELVGRNQPKSSVSLAALKLTLVLLPQFQLIWVAVTGRLHQAGFGRPAKIVKILVQLTGAVNRPDDL